MSEKDTHCNMLPAMPHLYGAGTAQAKRHPQQGFLAQGAMDSGKLSIVLRTHGKEL